MPRKIKNSRFETALINRLQKILDEGTVHVGNDELKRWFGVDRLRKGKDGTFGAILNYWSQLTDDRGGYLVQVESKTGFNLFALSDVRLLGTDTMVKPRGPRRVM